MTGDHCRLNRYTTKAGKQGLDAFPFYGRIVPDERPTDWLTGSLRIREWEDGFIAMKVAMFTALGKVEIQEMPRPTPGPGEALVKVNACAVCATDVKTVFKGHRILHPPMVLGHEIAGRIVELNGHAHVNVGDRVVVAPTLPCGSCYYCWRGEETMCENSSESHPQPGGYAEYLLCPAPLVQRGLVRIPDNLPDTVACLAEPIACAVRAARISRIKPGSSVVIIGDGPMAMFNAACAKAYGATQIIMSGIGDNRLKIAAQHYVDVTVDVQKENLESRVKELTNGRGADAVIVTVARTDAVRQGIGLVRPAGTVNIFAGQPVGSIIELDVSDVHYHEMIVTGTFSSSPSTMAEALTLVSRVDFSPIVTKQFKLDDVMAALHYSSNLEGLRPVIVMD
jgi:L-iditol 2-dehydrogenase